MAEILAIEASGGNDFLENWWQFILLAIIAVSVFVGVVALVWTLYNFLRKRRQVRSATLVHRGLLKAVSLWLLSPPSLRGSFALEKRVLIKHIHLDILRNSFPVEARESASRYPLEEIRTIRPQR